MQTKLTLRMDTKTIRKAKARAKRSGISVSKMISDYIELSETRPAFDREALPPIVKSLLGALKGSNVDEKDYYEYIERKHR